jgi:hypothetical protein
MVDFFVEKKTKTSRYRKKTGVLKMETINGMLFFFASKNSKKLEVM